MLLVKILSGLLFVCLLSMAVMAIHSSNQASELKATSDLLVTANNSIAELNRSLSKQKDVSKVTDQVVANAIAKTTEVTTKAKELSSRVVKINRGVVDGKINDTVADAAYIDSMWAAYCEAKPSDNQCSTRRIDPRFSSR